MAPSASRRSKSKRSKKSKRAQPQPEPQQLRPCEVCRVATAFLSCPDCKKVVYCSDRHEEQDRRVHYQACPPYKIVREPNKRSYLVATRDIPEGALIIKSEPLVIGPDGTEPVCLSCLHPRIYDVMSSLCEGCGWPVCWTDGCRQSKMHSLECQAMQKAGFFFDKAALYAKWHGNGVFSIFPGIWLLVARAILSGNGRKLLNAYRKEDHNSPPPHLIVLCNFKGGAAFIRETLKIKDFSVRDICGITKVLLSSAVPLQPNSHEKRCGQGVHAPDIFYLQHSCLPNVVLFETMEEPDVVKVQALANIPAGASLCAYVHKTIAVLTPTYARQFIFAKNPCKCIRCKDPTELGLYLGSFPCKRCSVGMMVFGNLPGLLVCGKCLFPMPAQHFAQSTVLLDKKLRNIYQRGDLHGLSKFIDDHSGPTGMLHKNHYLTLIAKVLYCDLTFKNSLNGDGTQFSTSALNLFNVYSADVIQVLKQLRQQYWHHDVRSKLVFSRNVMFQWQKGNITRIEAFEQLNSIYAYFSRTMSTFPVVCRNLQVACVAAALELQGHMQKLVL